MIALSGLKARAKRITPLRRMVYRAERLVDMAVRPGHYANLYYHKHWVRPQILETPPVACGSDEAFELRILTCRRDLLEALWAIKSFLTVSGLRPRVIVHEDGTFDTAAAALVSSQLPGAVVQWRREADRTVEALLRGFPACTHYRFDAHSFMSLKLFDVNLLSAAPSILLLDSDVLFFRDPQELREHIARGSGCYMQDYTDTFVTGRAELESRFELPMLGRVNCGVLLFPRHLLDLEFLESYFRYVNVSATVSLWHLATWGEQTGYALLMSRHPHVCAPLPETYAISKAAAAPDATCGHFVDDGSRELFYASGLKRLRQAGLLSRAH